MLEKDENIKNPQESVPREKSFGAPSRARTYNLSVNSRVLHH